MIEDIDSAVVDLPKLKSSREIEEYIKVQLLNYFPDPSQLLFDFILSRNKKSAFVVFLLKRGEIDNLDSLVHPFIIIKKIWKDGCYRFYYRETLLEVVIKNGSFTSAFTQKNSVLGIESTIKDGSVIFSDSKNYINFPKELNVLVTEPIYKKYKGVMFKERKPSFLPKLFLVIILIFPCWFLYKTGDLYSKEVSKLEKIDKEILDITEVNNIEDDLRGYRSKLEDILKVESFIPPRIYDLFYELSLSSNQFKIVNFTYNGNSINISATTNSILKLLEELNRSHLFNFKLISMEQMDNYEFVTVKGVLLW